MFSLHSCSEDSRLVFLDMAQLIKATVKWAFGKN